MPRPLRLLKCWNRFSWGGSSGRNLVEGNALVGTMVLRQAEDAFGDRVEQRLIRSARDAARRRVDPARRPVILGRGVLVERSEEHTSELQSLMRISYAVFCLKKKKQQTNNRHNINKKAKN